MPRSRRTRRGKRSRKRKRMSPDSDGDSAVASSSPASTEGPLSFDAFLALPTEVSSYILELAYSLPPLSPRTSAASDKRAELDAATTINLACTSRWFNAHATLRLYTHISITRPSALALLQRAIALRPQLGRLVKSLHVGAWYPLPNSWYPLRTRPGFIDANGHPHPSTTVVSTSLRSTDELPEGCTPGQEWSLEDPDFDRRSVAISRALLAAQDFLGIDLRGRTHSSLHHHPKQPLFELQAALDLYLIAMRSFEDTIRDDSASLPSSSPGGGYDCSPDYPPLIIIDASAQTWPEGSESSCLLTRQQIDHHLARTGGPTDRFDHPLLFARSGLDQPSIIYRRSNLNRFEPDDRQVQEPEDIADVFRSKDGLQPLARAETTSQEVLDPSRSSTATIGGLLVLTRSLLAMTPRLENLSLTGFLERVLCGRRPMGSVLKSLRCLSIGPPPETSRWYVPLRFDGLEEIQRLRVCGTMLRGDEIAQITGRYSELQWSLTDELPEEMMKSLGVLVDHLVGRKGVAADAALRELGFGQLGKLRLPFSYSAAQRDPPRPEENEEDEVKGKWGPLVEIRVRSVVYHALLKRAASEAERAAWETGRRGRHQTRRLLVGDITAASNSADDEAEALYKEGREWWERHQNLGPPRYQSHQRWPCY